MHRTFHIYIFFLLIICDNCWFCYYPRATVDVDLILCCHLWRHLICNARDNLILVSVTDVWISFNRIVQNFGTFFSFFCKHKQRETFTYFVIRYIWWPNKKSCRIWLDIESMTCRGGMVLWSSLSSCDNFHSTIYVQPQQQQNTKKKKVEIPHTNSRRWACVWAHNSHIALVWPCMLYMIQWIQYCNLPYPKEGWSHSNLYIHDDIACAMGR